MRNFMKLLNFELDRFIKIYGSLIAIVITSQIVGVIVLSRKYVSLSREAIYDQGMSQSEFLEMYDPFSFIDVIGSPWFMGPIALSAAGLIFYSFLIWYRDWFGKNTFIYRLLMLPTNRLNIFLAKILSIMLMVFGLISIQLGLLVIESKILKWIVPKTFRLDFNIPDIIMHSNYLQILIPQTFTEFILYYGLGFIAVSTLFTGILFERSYRLKGVILGAVYAAIVSGLLVLPLFIEEMILGGYFYMIEVIMIEIVLGIIIIAMSLWISNYLLKNKVTV